MKLELLLNVDILECFKRYILFKLLSLILDYIANFTRFVPLQYNLRKFFFKIKKKYIFSLYFVKILQLDFKVSLIRSR